MFQVTGHTENQVYITEHYAVTVTMQARGFLAEIKDAGSPYNGLYAIGSTRGSAMAALALKVSRAAAGR